jgi:hypothetical protein
MSDRDRDATQRRHEQELAALEEMKRTLRAAAENVAARERELVDLRRQLVGELESRGIAPTGTDNRPDLEERERGLAERERELDTALAAAAERERQAEAELALAQAERERLEERERTVHDVERELAGERMRLEQERATTGAAPPREPEPAPDPEPDPAEPPPPTPLPQPPPEPELEPAAIGFVEHSPVDGEADDLADPSQQRTRRR